MIDLRYSKRMDVNHRYLTGESFSLMDSAGRAIAEFVLKCTDSRDHILIICGPGNNGGDGFAAASHLEASAEVAVLPLINSELYTGDARKAMLRYKGRVADVANLAKEISSARIIIDSIFGTGIKRDPIGIYREAIELMNGSGKEIISVDVPSGFGMNPSVRPGFTVTFQYQKEGMTQENCGRIEVVKLGYHEKSERYAGPGEFVYYPYPLKDSHKGMNGVTAMVSGWEFRGSSILAALAASKAGTDLVKIYVRGSSPDLISVSYPSLIVRDTDRIGNATEEIGKADCVLVGPGMGKEKEASDFMKHVMSSTRNRIVVDADALAIVAQDPSLLEGRESVLTPHGGEFRKLTGKEPTEENAISAARKLNAVILMKGEVDIITDGTTTIHSEGGNPRLTMGGTGDILAGLVAFFMAKGIQPVRSASMASYLLKRTADYLFRDKAYWYDQMDLLETLAGTMKWIEAFIHSS